MNQQNRFRLSHTGWLLSAARKGLVWLTSAVLLSACGEVANDGADAQTGATNTSSSNSSQVDASVGYWTGAYAFQGGASGETDMVVSQSGYVVAYLKGANNALSETLFGQYDADAGRFSLQKASSGARYQGNVSYVSAQVAVQLNGSDGGTLSMSLSEDSLPNNTFKVRRSISALAGTWYLYHNAQVSGRFTMSSSGYGQYYSSDIQCQVTVQLSGEYTYSDYLAGVRLSSCQDSNLEGYYQGIAMADSNDHYTGRLALTLSVNTGNQWYTEQISR